MKEVININGKDYRVEVTWGVLTEFCEKRGIKTVQGLSELSDISPVEVAPLLLSSVKAGERADGKKCELTLDDILSLPISAVMEFFEILNKQISATSTGADTKKKKMFQRN